MGFVAEAVELGRIEPVFGMLAVLVVVAVEVVVGTAAVEVVVGIAVVVVVVVGMPVAGS